MKNTPNLRPLLKMLILGISVTQLNFSTAQPLTTKQTIAIADFDTRGYTLNQQQILQYISAELIRINMYEVMDKYDVEYIAKKDSLNLNGCFSKACLTEVGTKLNANKMLTGSISQVGDKLIVSFRMLDVKSGSFEKMTAQEFLVLKGSEFVMIRVALNELFSIPNDGDLVKKLTLRTELESTLNNPYQTILRADGPRMGISFLSGLNAQIIQKKPASGGYDGNPYMFQFGYQFERQYLNEGNFQALFEFIPMITGLDQGRFIPSFTFMNGLRSNKSGWEFAFGPSITFSEMAEGFYDPADKNTPEGDRPFYIKQDNLQKWRDLGEPETLTRMDSRGNINIVPSFVFAVGKTFRSGRMNIPVNAWFIPGKNGPRFGVSMGWNAKERYLLNN